MHQIQQYSGRDVVRIAISYLDAVDGGDILNGRNDACQYLGAQNTRLVARGFGAKATLLAMVPPIARMVMLGKEA